MNIFKKKDGFIGSEDINKDSFASVFAYAEQVRNLLGEQGYLVDHYLSLFFDTVHRLSVFGAIETGMSMPCDYHELCRNTLSKRENMKTSPLFPAVCEKLNNDANIRSYLEQRTRIDLLYALMADTFLRDAIEQFVFEQQNVVAIGLDEIYFKRLYERIADVVGEDMMDELNRRLKEKFLVSTAAAAFVQGFTAELISRLVERDIQTGKQIFQMLMKS